MLEVREEFLLLLVTEPLREDALLLNSLLCQQTKVVLPLSPFEYDKVTPLEKDHVCYCSLTEIGDQWQNF